MRATCRHGSLFCLNYIMAQNPQTRTLYVDYIHLNTQCVTLERLFGMFGKVKHVNLPEFSPEHPLHGKCKGYAFVEYYHHQDADRALQFFHNANNLTALADQIRSEDGPNLSEAIQDQHDIAKPMATTQHATAIKSKLMYEFRNYVWIRVMSRDCFAEHSKAYHDAKFKSLVNAAKSLIVN